MNSNKQAVEASELLALFQNSMGSDKHDLSKEDRRIWERIDACRAELGRPLEVAAPVTDEEVEAAAKTLCEWQRMNPNECLDVAKDGTSKYVWQRETKQAREILETFAASRAQVASVAVPVAWAVYWGIRKMQKNSVHFERKTAEEVAATIKSGTEIRPLYTQPPKQDATPPAQGDAKDAERMSHLSHRGCLVISSDDENNKWFVELMQGTNSDGEQIVTVYEGVTLRAAIDAAFFATSSKGGAA